MGDENRVRMMRHAADIARMARLLGTIVFVNVQRSPALELLLQAKGHGLIGLVHVREERVAAGARELEREEERVFIRPRGVAGIDVEPEFALTECADRLA